MTPESTLNPELAHIFKAHKIINVGFEPSRNNGATVWLDRDPPEGLAKDLAAHFPADYKIEFARMDCEPLKPLTNGIGMTKEQYMKFHENACARMMEVTRLKNADYTGGSEDPFSNFTQIGGLVQLPNVVEIGFLTRMSDKISRIGSFVTKGALLVKDESVEDTLIDLANYCILFAGYLKSKKGQTK